MHKTRRWRRARLLWPLWLLLLASCGASPNGPMADNADLIGSPQPNFPVRVEETGYTDPAVVAGLKYRGTPYEYGSERDTTSTFDCSDFVRQAYKEGYGITLPSDSKEQGEYVKKQGHASSDLSSLHQGDILFFMGHRGGKKEDYANLDKSKQPIEHDGLYLGDGKILHTYSAESGGVHIENIAGTHWEYRFLFGGPAH